MGHAHASRVLELVGESESSRYEHQIRVTNLALEMLNIADLNRQRANIENRHDELTKTAEQLHPPACSQRHWDPILAPPSPTSATLC